MGNSSYENQFEMNKRYRAKCLIMSPNGMVKEDTVLTGKEWEDVLVFGIGHGFGGMFQELENLPKLYKKTSTGKIQEWEVHVENFGTPTIVNNYGQVGGKIQESREEVLDGKNIGKKNETTALEQALLQAKSRWEKQKKKGYVENPEDAEQGKTDDIIAGGVFPILAHKFAEQGHKIKYPALAQPKLDGHRCTSQRDVDTTIINESLSKSFLSISLWSRTRKIIIGLPHINAAIERASLRIGFDFERLDGELYHHDYREKFEELTSFINQKDEPKKGHEIVQYHVYDIPDESLTNKERYEILEGLRPIFEGTPVHIVESVIVNDEDELYAYLDDCLARGYEGAMVRNMDGKYEFKRSYDLQKLKKFDDDEFRIVDVKIGTKGSMAGKAVFICERTREDQLLPEGETFDVKMKGDMDKLKEYADDPSLVIGKIITVKYQGYTKKNSKPRFGVGERFRVEL